MRVALGMAPAGWSRILSSWQETVGDVSRKPSNRRVEHSLSTATPRTCIALRKFSLGWLLGNW